MRTKPIFYYFKHSFFILVYLLFFFILLSPGSNQGVKYVVLLFIILSLAILEVNRFVKPTLIKKDILFFSLLYPTIGSLYILYGLINENPGALYQLNAYVIYPLFFTFLLRWISFDTTIKLIRAIMYGNIIIGLHALAFILAQIGILPMIFQIKIGDSSGIGIYEDHMGLALPSLSTLIYTIPFSIFLLFMPSDQRKKIVGNIPMYIGLVLTILIGLLSLRRGLILAIFLSPLLGYFILILKEKISLEAKFIKFFFMFIKISIVSSIIFSVLQLTGVFDVLSVVDTMINPDNLIKQSSNLHKFEQTALMFEEWSKAPFFGYGHGAVMKGILSSVETPWAYESTYALLLHNTGLVGFIFYSLGVIWIFYKSFLIYFSNSSVSYLAGALMIGLFFLLIANTTNPYIGKFDSMWIIFLPLALINSFKDKKVVNV